MRIAVVTTFDLKNHGTWSTKLPGAWGASYYLVQALKRQGVEVDYISPLTSRAPVIDRLKARFYAKVLKKNYKVWAEPALHHRYAREVGRLLSGARADLIFCPKDIWPIARLESPLPIVFYGDAANASLIDYYWFMCNLCSESRRKVMAMEREAFHRCALVSFYSQWAVDSAREIYRLDPSKLLVVEAGGNLDVSFTSLDLDAALSRRSESPFRLVFLGQDWLRKGGDIAVKIAGELNDIGLKTELVVIGCQPESVPPFVKVVGFLDKANPADKQQLVDILSSSHLLILISRAETYGHVLCEANSLGLPCITSGTGAMPCIIKHGANGGTFSPDASVREYVEWISELFRNPESYQKLARQAWGESQSRLNWDRAAERWIEAFERVLA